MSEDEAPRSLSDDPVIITSLSHPADLPEQVPGTQLGLTDIAESEAPKDLEGQEIGDRRARARFKSGRGDSTDVIRAAKDFQLNTMRHHLAWWLLVLVGVVAIALIVAVSVVSSSGQSALRDMATLIFPSLVTLAGTSLAWFYRGRGGSGKPGG